MKHVLIHLFLISILITLSSSQSMASILNSSHTTFLKESYIENQRAIELYKQDIYGGLQLNYERKYLLESVLMISTGASWLALAQYLEDKYGDPTKYDQKDLDDKKSIFQTTGLINISAGVVLFLFSLDYDKTDRMSFCIEQHSFAPVMMLKYRF